MPMPENNQQWCLWAILDNTLDYRIGWDLISKAYERGFMFMKLMDIVSIVADKETNLLVAD